ncbi:MAG: hypothetical protein JRG72_11835, partial [Deltaproteobacteria bacterium]|nr:hypothetical protein [Deltaproteobacteria bacterium]
TKVTTDFFFFSSDRSNSIEIDSLVENLLKTRNALLSCPIDGIIEWLDAFARRLLNRANPIHHQFPDSGIPYLASWCRRSNLELLLGTCFQDLRCLDDFVSLGRSDRMVRAFPRGLVVHWMAGNVPTLSFLSLLMGLLTKNVNLIKVASGSPPFLAALLKHLSETPGQRCSGQQLIHSIAVIRYDHKDEEIGATLSRYADVRIMWGSDESIQSIRALPVKPQVNDVAFPHRTSFIILGEEFLDKVSLGPLTRRVARDISIFEQSACASPHTILLLTKDKAKLADFAESLQDALEHILQDFPKASPTPQETAAILNLRARYDMFHEAWYSSGTEFTILADDFWQLGPPIGNRTVYLRLFSDIDRLPEIMTPHVQTVGLAVSPKDFSRIITILGAAGVHRFATPGTMTQFDSPWDGYFLPHHLVRWTSFPLSAIEPRSDS